MTGMRHITDPAMHISASVAGREGMMSDMLAAAIRYTQRGWIVHRLHPPTAKVKSPGKQPVDTGWATVTTPPTEAKLEQWFGNGKYNIGLVCGEASDVTVIDLDRMIYADIFNGVKTLWSARTEGRGHVFFKYNPRLKASKHHNLGIEILNDGNNVVLAPSIHTSRDVYRWEDPDAPLAEMPEAVELILTNLFKREKELNALVSKCRPCFRRLFKTKIREATDFHGAEGRELMLAWGTDLKVAGATLADAEMWARIIYGDGFDKAKTVTEWRGIDEKKTWKCATIADKLGGVIVCGCDTCKWKAPTAPAAAQTTKAPVADMTSTDRLIELGKRDTVFFHTPDDTCYAAVKLESGGSAIYLVNEKSRQFKQILKHRYYNATGKAPAAEPLKAAIGVLESISMFEGETIELHNRVAWHNGSICYDLTNSNYEAVEITSQGWGLMAPGHILFRRFGHQIPQTHPVSGGDVWRLYEFVNVPESDRLLDMVHLISCMVPGIPHPIPITTGEHGSTKTTACKMKKALIDPSDLDVMALQPNEDRMVQLMYHHWFIIFDNVTYLQQWQSDMLCRACTGEGTVKRTLYTNEDDTIFKYKRCIGLNGINNAATKPDLLDRAFFLNHEPIPKDRRIEEKVLFERFNEVKPEILGGMFDALSAALRIRPNIELKEKPRMADFAVWGCAIAEALGRTKEEFMEAYYANIGRINREALDESMIGNIMLAFMEDKAEWEGTPTQLHNELEMLASAHGADVKSKAWVKTPRSLGKRLRLIIPNLREEGIVVDAKDSGDRKIRIVSNLYYETKTPQTPQTPETRPPIANSGVKTKRHVTPVTPEQTPGADGENCLQTPTNAKRPTNAQKKTATGGVAGRLCVSGVSTPTLLLLPFTYHQMAKNKILICPKASRSGTGSSHTSSDTASPTWQLSE